MKCRATSNTKKIKFQRLMMYLCNNEMVAVLDCNSAGRARFLVPYTNTDSIGFWYHVLKHCLTLQAKVLAARKIAAQAKAKAKAKAARIAAEVKAEADRIATEAKATRIAAEVKAKANRNTVEAKAEEYQSVVQLA
jgi:hypothetical protein